MRSEEEIRERVEQERQKSASSIYGRGFRDASIEMLMWVLEEENQEELPHE